VRASSATCAGPGQDKSALQGGFGLDGARPAGALPMLLFCHGLHEGGLGVGARPRARLQGLEDQIEHTQHDQQPDDEDDEDDPAENLEHTNLLSEERDGSGCMNGVMTGRFRQEMRPALPVWQRPAPAPPP